ncbi:class I SAM-dependent RNA methyltransferase [Ahrensia sp. R2A130]|uniref:class I SAM-dependent RNA methyltransferase n=1 Tax=Ahrensia sp. R2A130 TaxID=744979 RepID=UPI0001E0D107|nr:class I SAM-dependent RNA methyltransferase [Ahrensia sp. R2A130]EFL88852.1 RNA methyltransferase [Ahrensia sp. R2A130]
MTDFTIDALGTLGHGIAKDARGHPAYIPRTIPGERVEASGEAPHLDLDAVLEPSPDRIDPICPHFERCGGCTFQHMSLTAQRAWKRSEVERAFAKAGLKVEVAETIGNAPNSRRRVTMTAWREGGAIKLGYSEQGSTDRVPIQSCPILVPELGAALGPLQSVLATVLQGNAEARAHMTAADNGIDVGIETSGEANEDTMAAMVRAFARSPFLRISVDGEVAAAREHPIISFQGATVELPTGAFLQAVKSAEDAMLDLASRHLKKSKRVADLFSGLGTFTFPLSANSKVHAVESDVAAVKALHYAQRDGGKAVTSEIRDLIELPLMPKELEAYDGVCLDPPRAGAAEQIAEIARTDIRRIAYISCNPVTQARDVAVLVKAGWSIASITPVDQFVFSPHIESVALLEKLGAPKKRSIFR